MSERDHGFGAQAGGRLSTDSIDARTRALACVGAALACGAPASTLRWLSNRARSEGATTDEIVATLFAVAPVVGTARLVTVAPDLAAAVGYDIHLALERAD